VLPSPVVAVEPRRVLGQVVPPSQATAPVLATPQARENMAVVGPKRAAPNPKTTTKPRKAAKTVAAAQRQGQATVQVASQAPAPTQRQSQATAQVTSQAPATVQVASQAPEQRQSQSLAQVAIQVPAQVVSQAPAQRQSQAPVQAAIQAPAQVASQAPAQRPSQAPAERQSQAPEPEQVASQEELLHECPVCHKMFNKSRSLNAHMTCHPDGRRHPCVFCMGTFPSSSALRSHVRRSSTCGGNNRRRLGPVAAAAIAWHSIDLNMPDI
jgi:hypothetical protein